MKFPIMPYTREKLEALANPISAQQPEALPWCFYDSRLFTSATTVQDTYFQVVQTDKTKGNIPQPGSLPTPQYFQVFYVGLDVQRDKTATASATSTASAVDDVAKLVLTTNTRAVLTVSGKPYMEVPLSFLHCSGGVTGYEFGGLATSNYFSFANNSTPGAQATWCTMGTVIIPPNQAFDLTSFWTAAVTLTANVNLRPFLIGAYYRRVL